MGQATLHPPYTPKQVKKE